MGILDTIFGTSYQTPGINQDASTPLPTPLGRKLPNVFMTPNLAEAGLLGADDAQALAVQNALQQQATKAGLLSAGVSFLTQPRNLQAGSALPYLGRAYQQGMASAGDIYGTGLTQLARQQAFGQKKQYQTIDVGDKVILADQITGETIREIPKSQVDKLPTSIEEFEYAQKNPDFKDFLEKKKDKGIEINLGGDKFADTFGQNAASLVSDSFNKATAAQTTLSKINDIRPIIKEGVFAGPFSTSQRVLTQIGSKLGVASEDAAETLTRTAEAMQSLAGFELEAAAAMKGQGTITENERLLIQRAAAGRIGDFTSDEINTLLNAMEKTSQYRIDIHNNNLSTIANIPEAQRFLPLYKLPELKVGGKETSTINKPTQQKRTREDILKQYGVQ